MTRKNFMFSKERRLETRHLNMIKSSPFFELRYLAVKCKKWKSPFQNWEWTLLDREFFSDSNDPMLAWQDPSVMSNKFEIKGGYWRFHSILLNSPKSAPRKCMSIGSKLLPNCFRTPICMIFGKPPEIKPSGFLSSHKNNSIKHMYTGFIKNWKAKNVYYTADMASCNKSTVGIPAKNKCFSFD